jgi:poly-gamma-glutamate capsule biosynthesis protein CapA/YwtB (metallophosphatase superfamily)
LAVWERGRNFPALSSDAAATGTFIHFGSHVAVLWEDRPPLGQLDETDLVAHHLEGLPEIVPLGQLLRTRDRFRVLQLKPLPDSVRLIFGGDVMLGRNVATTIDHEAKPLGALAAFLSRADFAAVNLECVASPLGEPVPGQRYHFRAHPQSAALLTAAGVDAVSVANNHSHDFGDIAFADSAKRLRAAGLQVAGDSTEPVVFTHGPARFSLFACYDEAPEPLLAAMRAAADSSLVVVMAHWGNEHSATPSEAQRDLAAKLSAAGARILVGSGPHCRQPMEFQGGALLAWSLGNLIFDGPGPDAAWSRGALLEVTLTPAGRIVRARELRVQMANDGAATLEDAAR